MRRNYATLIGLAIAGSGIPMYVLWKKLSKPRTASPAVFADIECLK